MVVNVLRTINYVLHQEAMKFVVITVIAIADIVDVTQQHPTAYFIVELFANRQPAPVVAIFAFFMILALMPP